MEYDQPQRALHFQNDGFTPHYDHPLNMENDSNQGLSPRWMAAILATSLQMTMTMLIKAHYSLRRWRWAWVNVTVRIKIVL